MPIKDLQKRREYQRVYKISNKKRVSSQIEAWQQANMETIVAQRANRKRLLKLNLVEQFGGSCMDCGIESPDHPEIFDFDHVIGEKNYEISKALTLSPVTLQEELTKCQLVCSNCHRIRTRDRIINKHDNINIGT